MDDDLIAEPHINEETTVSKAERDWMERQYSQHKIGTLISMDLNDARPVSDMKSLLEELKGISGNLKEVKIAQDNSSNHKPSYMDKSTQKNR